MENKLLWLLLQYIADGYAFPDNNEILFLNNGNLISYQGRLYKKLSDEETVKEFSGFCIKEKNTEEDDVPDWFHSLT